MGATMMILLSISIKREKLINYNIKDSNYGNNNR